MKTKDCSLQMYNILQYVKKQLLLNKYQTHLTRSEKQVINHSLNQYYTELDFLYRLANLYK
jgi:hypothetical protein